MGTQPRTGYERVQPPTRQAEPKSVSEGAEPTDEQLCNVAAVLGFPILTTPMFRSMPHWRDAMLNLHALLQRAACGDTEAAATMSLLVESFAEGRSRTDETAEQSPPNPESFGRVGVQV